MRQMYKESKDSSSHPPPLKLYRTKKESKYTRSHGSQAKSKILFSGGGVSKIWGILKFKVRCFHESKSSPGRSLTIMKNRV
jgi:hypothetical protein